MKDPSLMKSAEIGCGTILTPTSPHTPYKPTKLAQKQFQRLKKRSLDLVIHVPRTVAEEPEGKTSIGDDNQVTYTLS